MGWYTVGALAIDHATGQIAVLTCPNLVNREISKPSIQFPLTRFLWSRFSGDRNYKFGHLVLPIRGENRGARGTGRELADSPSTILQTLADKVYELLHADSAGLIY